MARLAAVPLLLIGACASPRQPQTPTAPPQCLAGALADSLSPTREGFFREVLFAAPTPRTPRFDDYTPGSYHADKRDLALGLPLEAARCGLRLRALLVVGPIGPLWTFYVVPFIQDADSLRVNTVVMPHARITTKGTARITDGMLRELVTGVTRSPLVKPGLPPFLDSTRAPMGRDASYNFLLAVYGREQVARYWHATLWEAMRDENSESRAHLERILESVTPVFDVISMTYGGEMFRPGDTVPP